MVLMHGESSGSCIVRGAVDGCHARRFSKINVSMQHKACIRLIGGVRSPKGSKSHYMLCRKSYCSGLCRSYMSEWLSLPFPRHPTLSFRCVNLGAAFIVEPNAVTSH